MNCPIILAIVSDIHVGSKARSMDLRADALSENIFEHGYIDRFLQFVRDENLRADYLIVPGDASNHGRPIELSVAFEALQRIASALSVSQDNILFVPGNHDVYRKPVDDNPGDLTGFFQKQIFKPLSENDHFQSCVSQPAADLLLEPYYAIWEFDNLLAVGLNTAWRYQGKNSIDHGHVAYETIQSLRQTLGALDLSLRRLKIFVLHHHPIQYRNPDPSWVDFSILDNAGDLIELVQDHKFDRNRSGGIG